MFKSKTEAEIVAENRKMIETNSKTVGKLSMLVEKNGELVSKLNDLAEKLKYLKPAKTQKATKCDIKIANKIDDLKSELKHFDGEINHKISKRIEDILLLLVERND